jgi:CheY-like chemotaxis protein
MGPPALSRFREYWAAPADVRGKMHAAAYLVRILDKHSTGDRMIQSILETHAGNSSQCAGKYAPTVLVVDDEPLVRWSVAETLGDSGFHVTQACDAASAIQAMAAADGPPDIVLLDLCLPDSNDLRALSVIHRLFPALPIILMTVHGSPELFADARRRGAMAVLAKPFEVNDLAPLVERALAARPS